MNGTILPMNEDRSEMEGGVFGIQWALTEIRTLARCGLPITAETKWEMIVKVTDRFLPNVKSIYAILSISHSPVLALSST